jgi:chromosome segregation ATPase
MRYNGDGRKRTMWTEKQRERYDLLSEREQAGILTDEETTELAAMVQQLCDHEAAYLAPANARKLEEIADVSAAVERLEIENRRLREYLHARRAFLARVRATVAQLQAEDRDLRQRYAELVPPAGERPGRSPS